MSISPNIVCLTVDEEWAHPSVLADLCQLFDERSLRATFFCTQPDVKVPGHERGLHPNFRRNGDLMQRFLKESRLTEKEAMDSQIYRGIVQLSRSFCPEAKGVRAHSLHYDSELLKIYHHAGIEYDSSCALPLAENLYPVWKEYDILEFPIYYIDHFDLKAQRTGFELANLRLNQPGLKVLDFHPNMVFINARTNEDYLEMKPFYHDYERLLAFRRQGRGVRTIFLDLLDYLARRPDSTMTLGELNKLVREKRA
jgi:hypothetical protein